MSTLTSIEQYPRLIAGLASCSPQDKVEIVRRLARTDLYFLLWFVCGRKDVARPWLYARCREVQEAPNGYLDLWARDHYKSSLITFGLTLQDILSSHGDDPDPKWGGAEPTFGIFSHTRPNAKAFLRQLKRELETNDLLKSAFPDVLWGNPAAEASKWSEDEGIIVKRRSNPKEATVEAWGLVDGQPTSKHFRVRVYDDVVTRESVTTPDMVRKTTEAWELSINLGTEDGVERYIGTRYAAGDTYSVMLNRTVVTPRLYPATHDGTASGEPVLLSKASLESKRQKMGAYTFSCQMLQNPTEREDAFFKREWFKWYREPPERVTRWGSGDYAVTDGGGDETEMGIHGVGDDGDLYLLLDGWHGKTSSDKWVEHQVDLIGRHKPFCFFGESGVIRRSVEPFLVRRMRETKQHARLEWLPSIQDKPARARPLQAWAAQGRVHLPDTPEGHRLLDQLLAFPQAGVPDDAVDMAALMARALDEAHPATKAVVDTNQARPDGWDAAFDTDEGDSWRVQ